MQEQLHFKNRFEQDPGKNILAGRLLNRWIYGSSGRRKLVLLTALTLFAVLRGNAQTYTSIPIPVTGFNEDIVANGTGHSNLSTNNSVDNPATDNFCFVAQNFISSKGLSPSSYLPANGIINSAQTPGLTFQLAPYNGNNSLLVLAGSSGTLTLPTPQSAEQVCVLLTAASYASANTSTVTVNFTAASGGGNQIFTGNSIPNWYAPATNYAFKGMCRVSRTTDDIQNPTVSPDGPKIYQLILPLSTGNATKNIESITFAHNTASSYLHVMGITGRTQLTNDLAITAIPSVASGCGLTNQETITATIQNYGSAPQSNIPVSYTINGGTPVTETFAGPLAAGQSVNYSFTTKADLTGPNTYNIVAQTNLVGDAYTGNDAFTKSIVSIVPVATYPYFQNFESGAGNWVSGGTSSTWALGKPAKSVINTAASGTNSWVTHLTGSYNNSENSWVESPCMNFSSLLDPIIEMKIWWNMENNYDKAALQSSIDGGATWQHVGAFGDPNNNYTANWYNNNSTLGPGVGGGVKVGWSGRTSTSNGSKGWKIAKHALTGLGGKSSVKLRIAFGADGSGQDNGFAFDDISIKDKPASDAGITSITSPATTTVLPGTPTTIAAKVKNYGTSPLTTVTLAFNVNGGTATNNAITLSTPLAQNAESAAETIGTYSFPAGVHILNTWSQDPNGAVDGDNSNDTLQMTIYSCNPLAGAYTIDKTQPASATSFQSFADVLTTIKNCGIGGAVTFNVAPGSGPYNEQVVMRSIAGTSATNTITFNGNGNTIAFAPGATDQGVITLDNTDYVKFENFTISATTGWGVQIKNNADYTTISNNTINLPANTTSPTINGIGVGAGTTTAVVTTAGSHGSNTKILDNTINSGYYGIFITGNTGTNVSTGNEIKGNIVKDSYNRAISLYNTANTLVEGNDISCSTRATVTHLHGIVLQGTCASNIISKNRIHNFFDAATNKAFTVYGINHSSTTPPALSENIVKNNLIYNMNSTSDTYGLFTNACGGIYYYHNTVNLDYTANTALVNGFRQYTATAVSNVKLINNIFSINSGTSGVKAAIYVEAAGSTITSDNNVLYVTPGATNHFIGYYSSNRQTLADWKAVVPSTGTPYDQNSVSAYPKFIDAINGNLKPKSTDVDNIGQALAAVTDDITGPATRSTTTPDPGAYEFTPPPAVTYTWTGGSSTSPSNWFDASNWDQNSIPGISDNVVINDASVTQPVISSIGGPVEINNLDLLAGSLELGPGSSITVSGIFTYTTPATTIFACTSTFTYASTSSQTIYALTYGNLVSSGPAAANRTLASGIITICNTFTPGATNYTSIAGNTIEFSGPTAQSIPAFSYNNLTSSNTGARTISGIVKIAGIFTPGTNTYTVTGSTIDFNGTTAQTIPAFSYNNLTSSSTGARTISGIVKIAGTFASGSNTYTTTGSTVEFNGTGGTTASPLPIPALTGNYNKVIVSGAGSNYGFSGTTVTIDGDYTQTAGTVAVAWGTSGIAKTININGDFNISSGSFNLVNSSTASSYNKVYVGTTGSPKNLNITGSGSINLEALASPSTAGWLIVSGDFNSNTTATNAIDFGTGTGVGANQLQLGGNLNMSGTGKFFTSATGGSVPAGVAFTKAGVQTVNSSITHQKTIFTVNAGSTVVLASDLTMSGTATFTTPANTPANQFIVNGTLDMADKKITGGGTNNSFIVNANGVVKTSYATGLNDAVTSIATRTFNAGADLELYGTAAIAQATFPTAVRNLTVSNTNTVTLGSNVAVSGALTTIATGTLDLGTNQITGTGTATINGTLKTAKTEGLSGAANTALANTGAITLSSASTIEYNGTGAQTITARPDYQNLIISGARGGAGLTLQPGIIGVAQTFNPAATATSWTTTGNTVDFKGNVAQTIPDFNYNSLTSSATGARTISGTVQIADVFTPGTNAYTVTGSTVEFNGSTAQTIPAFSYHNLVSSSTGTRTLSGVVKIADTFTPGANAYTVAGSTVEFNGTGNQIIPAFSYDNLGSSSTGSRTISGTVQIAGAFIPGTNFYTVTGSTIEFNGTTGQTIPAIPVASGSNYNNLIISNTATGTLGAGIAVSGIATVNSGSTLDLGTNQITGTGTATVNGILKTAKTEGFSGGANTALANTLTGITLGVGSTIEYNGTGAQTITARPDYQDLTISGARSGAITLEPGIIGIAQDFIKTATPTNWTTTGNTVEFKGTAQEIAAFSFNNLKITGGSTDNKLLLGDISVTGTLTMNGGQLLTNGKKVSLGNTASLVETSATYVTGIVESIANMSATGTYTFNGIGLSLTAQNAKNFPGLTTVRRVTGTPITTPNGNQSIGRYFEIVPTTNSGLKITMVFSYMGHELGNILESNLTLFKSSTTSGPWSPQGYDSRDVAAKTVTLSNIKDFSVWTLGDGNAPLPVELVSFEAKKVGTNAELIWLTASEHNSQGFEVQVSANGKDFRKLGFVESRNGNTMQQYNFTDAENGKTGIRYYRLKQIDFDGKVTYYAVKAVRFDAEKLQLSAYPNPFQNEVNLAVAAADAGKATLKLTDLSGKTVFEQEVSVQKGNNKLTVGLDKHLPAGVYVLQAQFGSELITTRLLKK